MSRRYGLAVAMLSLLVGAAAAAPVARAANGFLVNQAANLPDANVGDGICDADLTEL